VTAIAKTPSRLSAPAKLRLAGEIVWTTLHVRRLVLRNALPAALSQCRAVAPAQRPALSDDDLARLSRAVRRTLTVLPGDSRCLVSSLVLVALLARRGVETTLVIGVRPGAEFGAHAWVEVGGVPVMPADEGEFARLVAL
jgi:hypothetical protein